MTLPEYGRKRRFELTGEPPPRAESGREGPLVFVVHKHAARQLHYDLRLELGGVFKSWSVPKGPSYDPQEKRLAVMVEDHPFAYRSFEGVIPAGEYGAGAVIIWDHGTYSPDEDGRLSFGDRSAAEERLREGLEKGKLSFTLRGQKLKGSWTLVKMRRGQKDWLLIKHKDGYADARHDVLAEERSVFSGLSVEELKAGEPSGGDSGAAASPADVDESRPAPFPASLAPMLATPAAAPFDDDAWLFEPKLDGFRTIAFIQDGVVRLRSRRGLDVTARYTSLLPDLERQPASALVLDGEIIALDGKGRQCFQCLQDYLEAVNQAGARRGVPAVPLVYYVFDLLYLDGYDLRRATLQQRKGWLAAVLQTSAQVRLVEHFPGSGRALYKAALDNGLEGVVAKRRDSVYEAGKRSPAWLKVKGTLSDDFVIGGYTRGSGSRAQTFGALLLGYFDRSRKLTYVGHVGSGFDENSLREIRRALDALQADRCPFSQPPPANAPASWVRPELVAEVKYSQFTRDGFLRSPIFRRLRPDKPAAEVRKPAAAAVVAAAADPPSPDSSDPVVGILRRLQGSASELSLDIEGQPLRLSNLDKELWPPAGDVPAVTKRGLIAYLARVSPYLLPHLRHRPLTFSRYPDGIQGEHFFQKHWGSPLPDFVETLELASDGARQRQQYLMCNNLATLLWLGQVANLEIHTWFSRANRETDIPRGGKADRLVRFPDFLVFDLDPFIYSGKEPAGAEPELNREAYRKTGQVALWLREVLDSLALASFVKTSGGTGIHVYVPLLRRLDYRAVRSAAETIARFIQKQHPADVTLDWAVEKRRGKVFIDYNQNSQGKTLASIYSPRPRPRATVSTPLHWDEVGASYPDDFTIFTVPERLRKVGDLWSGILAAKSDLTRLAESASLRA